MELQKQNILFFTRTMKLGGTENVILQLCEVFKPLVNKIVVCSCGGVNEEKLKAMGIAHYAIPDIEMKSPAVLCSVRKTIKQIISLENVTVIHTHHRMAAFYCQFLGLKKNIQLINTSHTAFYDKKALTHFAFRGFSLIACGEGVKNSLVEGLGFSKDRITVICNGVRRATCGNDIVLPEIEKVKSSCEHVLAYIGRISKEKGLDILVEAFSILNNPSIRCIVVGDGPEEERIRSLIEEKGLEDQFVFLGFRNDASSIISQVDFIVQPSLQEGLPLVPIEAFASGKTVIGTEIDGTKEIICDQKNGLLVKPGDPFALASAIQTLCGMNRSSLEREALKTFEQNYSFEVFSDRYIRYYKEIK